VAAREYHVFSRQPDSVSWEEYDRWYDLHVQENIEQPGFISARRFRLEEPVVAVDGMIAYTHLAVYEYEGDIMDLRAGLRERIDAGQIVLPDWFPEIAFLTWDCVPVSGRFEAP
jgi:hypothetical protein